MLGIGLSGAANLAGLGPQTAQAFFEGPRIEAEREYARELGTYTARQQEWADYYDQILAAQGVDVRERTLEETIRANIAREEAPFPVARGAGVYDPAEREMIYEDPYGRYATQWEAERAQAFDFWLEVNPGKTLETMTARDRDEAITMWRRRRGLETAVPGFGPEGELIHMPRGEAYYGERPAAQFDEFGNIIYQRGRTPVRPRAPTVTPEDIAREERWAADAKRQIRTDYRRMRQQPFAGRPGTARYEELQAAEQAEIEEIDRELEERLRGLRTPGIEPTEPEVRTYNPATGRVE